MFLNDKGVMTPALAVEQKVPTGSLHTVPAIHTLFTRHELKSMAKSVEDGARLLCLLLSGSIRAFGQVG